ncbi:endonuclease domain-containing protein [Demequina pelophila]|uniref:endonuclease domain-containing protein n=1 Tax=Demequina pelophila TaxID=1638984 RepID=UPI00078380DF|nr:DUF559 domain-containing protein [Demequina pelophila]
MLLSPGPDPDPAPDPSPGYAPTRIAEFLETNAHAYGRDELVHRWSRRQLDHAIEGGAATRLLTGVYCGTAHSENVLVLAEALGLWQPAGAVTGAGALHLYAPALPPPDRLDFVVPHGRRLDVPPWVRLHQTGPLHSRIMARGVFTSPMPRALLDAWRYAPPSGRRSILWEALWARACTWRQVRAELDRTSRLPGRRDLERVLGWFAEGATSPLEVRAKHETFTGARFREFEWQVPLMLPSGRVTPDMLHRRARIAVELDGNRYHSTRAALDKDRARRTNLAAAGYATVGFGWSDITLRPEWCRERLLAVVGARL